MQTQICYLMIYNIHITLVTNDILAEQVMKFQTTSNRLPKKQY